MNVVTRVCSVVCLAAIAGCGGGEPAPKAVETPTEQTPKREGPSGPVVEQELGSIDQRAVEKKFNDLQTKLEGCHSQGRSRVEYLAGDVKVFLRVGKDGRVKYSYFEDSTIGDRDTEKCILDVFGGADWPKPIGGEAEIRNGFGWPGGNERAPTTWSADKVTSALDADKDTAKAIEKCKSGVSGDFHVTAYVEPGEVDEDDHASKEHAADKHAKAGGKKGTPAAAKKGDKKSDAKEPEHGGKFKSIGVAAPNKDAAAKIECVVDGLRGLHLPSPGSYAAKVTFSL